jgi:hypothetical protein
MKGEWIVTNRNERSERRFGAIHARPSRTPEGGKASPPRSSTSRKREAPATGLFWTAAAGTGLQAFFQRLAGRGFDGQNSIRMLHLKLYGVINISILIEVCACVQEQAAIPEECEARNQWFRPGSCYTHTHTHTHTH